MQVSSFDSILAQSRTALLTLTNVAESSNDTLMQSVMAQRILNADTLTVENATITPDSLVELNERTVNYMYLKTIALGVVEFNSTQLGYLQDIAGQCPLIGGSAVFKARSLLAIVQDSVYNDSTLCAGVEERQAKVQQVNEVGFSMFPNPATNKVTILIPPGMEEPLEIVVYNSLGIPVLRKGIPALNRSFVLDISDIGEGLCLISIHQNKKRLFSEKLILVK